MTRSKSVDSIKSPTKLPSRVFLATPPRLRLPRWPSSPGSAPTSPVESSPLTPSLRASSRPRSPLSLAAGDQIHIVSSHASAADQDATRLSVGQGYQGRPKGGLSGLGDVKQPHKTVDPSSGFDTIDRIVETQELHDLTPTRPARPAPSVRPSYSRSSHQPIARRSATLPITASWSDLAALPSITEADDTWLCSRPAQSPGLSGLLGSPGSPISPRIATPLITDLTRSMSSHSITSSPSSGAKLIRPFVTHSTSTGRLAHEFDSDGRVVCLSEHSDKILERRQINDPARGPQKKEHSQQDDERVSESGNAVPEIKRYASAPTQTLTRSAVKACVDVCDMDDGKQMTSKARKGYVPVDPRHAEERAKLGLRPGLGKMKEWFSVA